MTVWDAGGMSDYSDGTLGRYLDQNAAMRRAHLDDPIQHAQVELMRQTLDATDRALADEGMPEDVRQRVINRVVWGDPDGLVDVHAERRKQVAAVSKSGADDFPVDAYRLSTRPGVVGGPS